MADPRDKGFQDYYRDKAKTRAASGYRSPDRDRRHPKQSSFFDRAANKAQVIHDANPINYLPHAYGKVKEYFPGSLGVAQKGVDAVLRNRKMHGENVDYFGGNWLNTRIPNRVKESLMTPRDKTFEDKYMRLAELTSDPDKRAEYIDTANTARQNMQITGRLNYGLGQIDPEGTYTNREGLPSYSQDLFGEGFNRFNLDKFKESMDMGEGILGGLEARDRHPDAVDSYAKETFGVDEMTDEEKIQGLKDEIQEKIDNFENPFPLLPTQEDIDDSEQDRIDDYYGKSEQGEMVFADVPDDIEPLPFDEGRENFIRGQNEYAPPVIPELGTPDPQGDFANFNKYATPDIGIEFGEPDIVPPAITPFDDSGREAGIAALYGQGPMWGETDRRYEDEYRDHIERTGERMSYEEFEGAWERLHALPRGLHYQEPRAGIR